MVIHVVQLYHSMIFLINCVNQNVIIKKKMRSISWDQCFFRQLHLGDKEKVVANGIKAFRKNKNGPILPYLDKMF